MMKIKKIVATVLSCTIMTTLLQTTVLAQNKELIKNNGLEENDYILYFANCGTSNNGEVSEGDKIGLYQSNVDQAYGEDNITGYKWGYNESTNPTAATGSGSNKEASIRYLPNNISNWEIGKTGIYYDFELEEGTYEVTVGFKNPWSYRKVDVTLENTMVTEQIDLNQNVLVENTYIQEVIDGELNVFISNSTRENQWQDPLVSYIIVKSTEQYTKELIEQTILDVTVPADKEEMYGPKSLQKLKDSIEEAKDIISRDDITTNDIINIYNELLSNYNDLKLIEIYENVPVGELWKDTDGEFIQAHGGGFLEYDGKYWWVGENKSHNGADFNGVNLYSSTDLKNWKYENTILQPSSHENLASCKVERPKLVYNKKTNKFVLWGHWETTDSYSASRLVVATSDTINGDYEYIKHFRPGVGVVGDETDPIDGTNPAGYGSRDFTIYIDEVNDKGYLISTQNHEDMRVYPLTDDYADVDYENSYKLFEGKRREAPALVKAGDYYFAFTSGQSGWYPNQCMYSYTKDISDPNGWSELKLIGNNTTFYSQPTNIMTLKSEDGNEKYIYMGDRWNSGKLGSSTYVWIPLEITGTEATMDFTPEWSFNVQTGEIDVEENYLVSEGKSSEALTGLGTDENYPLEKANDGIYTNINSSGGNSDFYKPSAVPFSWQVDLENVYDLSRIDISFNSWNGSESYHQYIVEGSNDKVNWTTILDESKNTMVGFRSNKLEGSYRYVRLSVSNVINAHNGNSASFAAGLVEVQIFANSIPAEDKTFDLAKTNFVVEGESKASNIKLQWIPVTGATRYEVYRAENNGEYELLKSINATSYEDYKLKDDVEYRYKIKAYNGEKVLSEANSEVCKSFNISTEMKVYDNTKKSSIEVPSSLKVDDTYYRFDYISDSEGFKELVMLTSEDGYTFSGDKVVLSRSDDEALKNCKFESMSIRYNEKTNEFVMWVHYENNKDYSLGMVAVAYAKVGEEFKGFKNFRPLGNDSRDLGFFQDSDGSAYLISSTNTNADLVIYKLTEDWHDVEELVTKVYSNKHREAPSLIKKDGVYYLFTSQAAGWYPSRSMYSSATSIAGPWTELREIGNTSTFSAQSGGVISVLGGQTECNSYVMFANRWMHGWKDAPEGSGHEQRILPISFANGYAFTEFYENILYSAETGEVIPVQNGKLVSEGKPAFASSNSDTATYANDGYYDTEWIANNEWPSSWTVDLEEVHDLSSVQISWYMVKGSEAYHQYKIEGSIDGEEYFVLSDKSTGYNDYGFTVDKISGEARYVRVTLVNAKLQNNPNNWYTPRLYEVKVFANNEIINVVDKTELEENINVSKELLKETDKYTEESLNSLKAVLEKATEVLNNELATEEEVVVAIEKLKVAMEALEEIKEEIPEEVDKSELLSTINASKELLKETSKYTAESLSKLSETLESAIKVYEDKNATKEDVLEAIKAIKDSISKLVKISVEVKPGEDSDKNEGSNGDKDDNKNDTLVQTGVESNTVLIAILAILMGSILTFRKKVKN